MQGGWSQRSSWLVVLGIARGKAQQDSRTGAAEWARSPMANVLYMNMES